MDTIDLHIHSNMSDGTYAPAELAGLARLAGLRGMTVTDHDTVSGVAEAAKAAARENIEFITGMEMSVQYKERRLHIVALGFDMKSRAFLDLYKKIREIKEADMTAGVAKMQRQGVPITMEELERDYAPFDKVDRYAIMRWFADRGLCDSVQEIWDRYIDPVFGMDDNIGAEEAVSAIHKAGGVTSLAHFHKRIGLLGLTKHERESVLLDLLGYGMDGMEALYPNFSREDRAFAAEMVKKYQLLPTGGSDFHGGNRKNVELGTGIRNNLAVPYEWMIEIKKRMR